jgi:hypothetical protein
MTPSPSLSPLALLLLSLARFIAPKNDKLWIGDMRLEAAFVPDKLRFALSALGLALKFRWEAIRQNRTATLAFASTALAALAVLLFVPRMFNNPSKTNAAMSAPSSYEGTSEYLEQAAVDRGISADAQEAAPAAEAPAPQTTAPTQDAVAEAPLTVQEPLANIAPTDVVPTPSGDGTVAEVPPAPNASEPLAAVPPPAAINPAPDPQSTDTASVTLNQEPMAAVPAPTEESADATLLTDSSSESSIETTSSESESGDATVAEAANSSSNQAASDTLSGASELDETSARTKLTVIPAPITPSTDTVVLSTQVRGDSVVLESTGEALLTLYRNSDFAGSPRIHRYLEAGETLTFGIPFSLYTNDASAITVTVDGSSFALSENDEEQFRVFTKP